MENLRIHRLKEPFLSKIGTEYVGIVQFTCRCGSESINFLYVDGAGIEACNGECYLCNRKRLAEGRLTEGTKEVIDFAKQKEDEVNEAD